MKSRQRKVPDEIYNSVRLFSDRLEVPATKGFIYRDKLLQGDFICRKRKRMRDGQEIFELEFGDGFR
jgi:hypothetical protein